MRKHPSPICASAPDARHPAPLRYRLALALAALIAAAAPLAKALENGGRAPMKSPVSDNFEFPVQASVIPWLRACSRRNGIPIEPVGQ
jgi:hypothetical protein